MGCAGRAVFGYGKGDGRSIRQNLSFSVNYQKKMSIYFIDYMKGQIAGCNRGDYHGG